MIVLMVLGHCASVRYAFWVNYPCAHAAPFFLPFMLLGYGWPCTSLLAGMPSRRRWTFLQPKVRDMMGHVVCALLTVAFLSVIFTVHVYVHVY
jgi:hypothetical protein